MASGQGLRTGEARGVCQRAQVWLLPVVGGLASHAELVGCGFHDPSRGQLPWEGPRLRVCGCLYFQESPVCSQQFWF